MELYTKDVRPRLKENPWLTKENIIQKKMEAGGGVDDELLATIRLITVTLDGMRED